jgi:hypothetical protein
MTRDDLDTALIQVRRALQAQAVTLLGHTLGSVTSSLLVTVYWQMLAAAASVDPFARNLLYRLAREYCDQRETGKPALEAVHAT